MTAEKFPTPVDVLKWATVVFVICLQLLAIMTIILAIFGVF